MTETIDPVLIEKANTELSKTKIRLMARPDSTFFTTLCFSLKHVWDDTQPTAATDGTKVYWNRTFFLGVQDPANRVQLFDSEERLFALVHECMHPAYLHMLRMPVGGCHDKWNIACDHVINLQLKKSGFKVPDWTYCDPAFTGMSAEEVYKLLPDNPGKPNMPDLKAPPGTEGNGPGVAAQIAKVSADIEDILVRASVASKMAGDKPGSIPGEIEIFLNKLLDPKLPWYRILQKYLQSFAKTDYTFMKPNRRFFPKHHLPSMWSSSLIDLAIFVDTSASVSDSDFLRFISETHFMLKMMKPKKITIGQFDTCIKSVDEVTSVKELEKVKFTGRGGTMIGPVMEWANVNKPQLLLIFTDGEFHFYNHDTKGQVLWLIHENPKFTAPFGKTIHYNM